MTDFMPDQGGAAGGGGTGASGGVWGGRHIPVLLDEVVRSLAPQPGETLLDCTAGLGGHSAALAPGLGPSGRVVLCDLDPNNLASAQANVGGQPDAPAVVAMRTNFADAPRRMMEAGLRADLVLADLGFASNQMDDAGRGFSFMREGPLDMRLDPNGPVTAADLVATLSERELADIIWEYGEERHARRVAQKLVDARRVRPIRTTSELAELVRSVVGRGGPSPIDPATRTFQALRIAVNDELTNLNTLLEAIERAARAAIVGAMGPTWLAAGARVGIITFHSLEDRPVKTVFAKLVSQGLAEHVTRKPLQASEDETRRNPRSRSAKLRVLSLARSPGPPPPV